jgi:hypothetical protein
LAGVPEGSTLSTGAIVPNPGLAAGISDDLISSLFAGAIEDTVSLEAGGTESLAVVSLAVGGDGDTNSIVHEPVRSTGFADLSEPIPFFTSSI